MQVTTTAREYDGHPFDLLLDFEARSLRHEPGEKRATGHQALWSGLGFRVGSWNLALTLAEVSEIIMVPRLTRVPGAKPWVRGIANLRGTVITVVDFAGFLGAPRERDHSRQRVLVLQGQSWSSGLLVDEVYGMRAFQEGEQLPRAEIPDSVLQVYVTGAFRSDDALWQVFNPSRLLNDGGFLATAA